MPGRILNLILPMLLLPGFLLPQSRTAEQLLREAQTHFNERRFDRAAALAREARTIDPALAAAWKLGGLSLQLAGQIPAAGQEFTTALQRFPADADLWFYLARVQYLQSTLGAAGQSARRALDLQPDHADAHTQMALVLEARGDDPEALAHYRRAIALNRQQQRPQMLPLLSAAQLLERLGRFDESLALLTDAVTVNSRNGNAHFARGRVLEKLRRFGEAEQAYRQAQALDHPQARGALERLRAGAVRDNAAQRQGQIAPITFNNQAGRAGLDFVLDNSATPRHYQVETMTGGVAVFDYDNDGWPDIFFVNGAELPDMKKTSARYLNRLYRNNRDGTFRDVTAEAGVAGEGYGMGVAVADYDNDGDQDLYTAGVNRNQLFRNEGNGRFSEVTDRAGLAGVDRQRGKMWSVAAAWLDYDNDGHLDLFVVNYCKWHADIDPWCGAQKEGWRTYCFPDKYEGLPNQLFRNNGDGTFTDVSVTSGIARHIGKGMGTATADYDDDGWIDIFVANDTLPNFLFRNNGRGSFDEVALAAGAALNDSGRPVSGMGVDFRDYDNDGLPDLIVSALEGETFPLFRNLGRGFFIDATWSGDLGRASIRRSGWGLGLLDLNNDGHKDLFTVNAHVNDNIELYNEQTYRQSNSVLANTGAGAFIDMSAQAGPDLQVRRAHRGCAFGDFNNDGRMDVVTTSLNDAAELLINESGSDNHWLKLRLVGTRSNRDGIGASIKVVTPSGRIQYNHVTTSVGYASASDRLVHFGLAGESVISQLEIRWPGGTVQKLTDIRADRLVEIREPHRQ